MILVARGASCPLMVIAVVAFAQAYFAANSRLQCLVVEMDVFVTKTGMFHAC